MPWAKGGVPRWSVDHGEQEERRHKLGMGKGWWGRNSGSWSTLCSLSASLPRDTQGMPLSQWGLLTLSGTECAPFCHPFSVLTSLICVIRLRLPAPGLFLLLSSPCWAGSSASPIGATWPGERSPPELFLGFLQSLSEEPSAFDVCRRRVLDDVTAPSILYPVALLGDGHHASAP